MRAGRLLTWPFRILWALATRLERALGILLLLLIGVVLMVVGLALTATIVGAIPGIPLFILGLLLTIRGIY